MKLGAVDVLQSMAVGGSDKVKLQCKRALANLGHDLATPPAAAAGGAGHK